MSDDTPPDPFLIAGVTLYATVFGIGVLALGFGGAAEVLRNYQGLIGGILAGMFTLAGGGLAYLGIQHQITAGVHLHERQIREDRKSRHAEIVSDVDALNLVLTDAVFFWDRDTSHVHQIANDFALLDFSHLERSDVLFWKVMQNALAALIEQLKQVANLGDAEQISPVQEKTRTFYLGFKEYTDALRDGHTLQDARVAAQKIFTYEFMKSLPGFADHN
jgi:hypothetical protein